MLPGQVQVAGGGVTGGKGGGIGGRGGGDRWQRGGEVAEAEGRISGVCIRRRGCDDWGRPKCAPNFRKMDIEQRCCDKLGS